MITIRAMYCDSNLGSKEWGRGFSTHLLPGVKKKTGNARLQTGDTLIRVTRLLESDLGAK